MISGGLRVKGVHKHSLPGAPLITVVTVVRNGGATLEETILSVVNQTYRNVEYIVVDGASTDGTLDIIRKYEDRIDYWVSERDGGIYDAMNKSLGIAEGDWINFMNGGDAFFEKTTVSKFVSKIIDADAVYYGDAYITVLREISCGEFSLRKLAVTNICHQAIFYPKISYKAVQYEDKYKPFSDWHYNMFLYKKVPFLYIDETVAVYEYGGGSSYMRNKLFGRDFNSLVIKHLGIMAFLYSFIFRSLRFLKRIFNPGKRRQEIIWVG